MSALAAAAIVTALVGLPPGAAAPPPGSVPIGAHVQILDRQLGIASVELRRRDAPRALARLRHAPGVRYVTVPELTGGLAAAAASCTYTVVPNEGLHGSSWRSMIHLSKHSAAGFTVGIPDTGADLSRLGGTRDRLMSKNFTNEKGLVDTLNHGTEVASLIGADRPDLSVQGVAPDVGLAIARIGTTNACDAGTIARGLIAAFAWFRKIGDVQIVNVSANIKPSTALIESLRALQESGTLVVAATGNNANPGQATFPASQPHVLGVGALASASSVWRHSGRGPEVDLVAPGGGMGVVYSSAGNSGTQNGTTPNTPATSFATPLVTGAAALVWAKHSGWDASRVAAALTMSAKHLSGARPNTTSGYGRLDVRAALRAIPPPDLEEPNDWASAARKLPFLTHKLTVAATVGGANDPLDAYPIATKGKSVVTISGPGTMQAYLVPSSSVGTIDTPAKLPASAARTGSGQTVHLKVPGKGSWFVVVTATGATAPVGYSLRLP